MRVEEFQVLDLNNKEKEILSYMTTFNIKTRHLRGGSSRWKVSCGEVGVRKITASLYVGGVNGCSIGRIDNLYGLFI